MYNILHVHIIHVCTLYTTSKAMGYLQVEHLSLNYLHLCKHRAPATLYIHTYSALCHTSHINLKLQWPEDGPVADECEGRKSYVTISIMDTM